MRACVQRVSHAKVTVNDEIAGEIGRGLLVLLGVSEKDGESDVTYLADKVLGLRVFEDEDGKMNRSVQAIQGSVLVVSQFTLYGDCRKGRRPSFISAARPEKADEMYQQFVQRLENADIPVETGRFQQHMDVELVNDGPVTLLLDSFRDF